jgi:hypothetical protein
VRQLVSAVLCANNFPVFESVAVAATIPVDRKKSRRFIEPPFFQSKFFSFQPANYIRFRGLEYERDIFFGMCDESEVRGRRIARTTGWILPAG